MGPNDPSVLEQLTDKLYFKAACKHSDTHMHKGAERSDLFDLRSFGGDAEVTHDLLMGEKIRGGNGKEKPENRSERDVRREA